MKTINSITVTPAKVISAANGGPLEVVEYSSASFAVGGDTYPHRAQLRALGTWNKFKKVWFVKKTHAAALLALIVSISAT